MRQNQIHFLLKYIPFSRPLCFIRLKIGFHFLCSILQNRSFLLISFCAPDSSSFFCMVIRSRFESFQELGLFFAEMFGGWCFEFEPFSGAQDFPCYRSSDDSNMDPAAGQSHGLSISVSDTHGMINSAECFPFSVIWKAKVQVYCAGPRSFSVNLSGLKGSEI